jgi:hypothetical protein
MAHSLPSERVLPPRRLSRALALPNITHLSPWPPLLLALLTLLALLVAYTARPLVRVDLGSYYDSAYLHNFHARELAPSGEVRTWKWPDDSNTLTLPGGLPGDWMATFYARPDLPGRPMRGVALDVNGYAVNIPGDTSHTFTAFLPADIVAAEELELRLKGTPTGTPDPELGTMVRVELAPTRTYRWTQGESTIALPGLGRGAWRLDLNLATAHPTDQPVNGEVLVNGAPLAALPDVSQVRRVSLLVPAEHVGRGNLEILLRANTYEDPRPLGVLVADMTVAPVSSSQPGLFTALPPPGIALSSLIIVLVLYGCLALLLSSGPALAAAAGHLSPRRAALWPWLAALAPLALIALGAWALRTHRFPTSLMLPELAGLALWSLLLLLLLRPLLHSLLDRSAESQQLVAGRWLFVDVLLLLFFLSYWLKAAGMLYPFFIGIDVHWHMERVRWILGGQLPLLYGINSPLNESTMPVAEWGANRPVIPYSPYFHMLATGFALLPWPLEFSANQFSALIDTSRILMLGVLAARMGLGQRAALLAAALCAVLPINFLLLSWGNMPTTTGLWLSFALTAFMLVAWHRLRSWGPFVALVVVLLASLLVYTVAGFFVGLFLVVFTAALWFAARRAGLGAALLPGLRSLWVATLAALALALLIYYGQYIPPIIERTIPYFVEAFTEGHEDTGRVGDTWSGYLLRHGRLASYGLVVPLFLTAVYLGWESWRRFRPTAAPADAPAHPGAVLVWAAVAGWAVVMLVFVPLAFTISMVDKHFLAAIPMMLLASGVVLDRFWRLGWPARLITLLYIAYLAGAAVNLWLTRIAVVRQIYE